MTGVTLILSLFQSFNPDAVVIITPRKPVQHALKRWWFDHVQHHENYHWFLHKKQHGEDVRCLLG
jgi:hypothetical protein